MMIVIKYFWNNKRPWLWYELYYYLTNKKWQPVNWSNYDKEIQGQVSFISFLPGWISWQND